MTPEVQEIVRKVVERKAGLMPVDLPPLFENLQSRLDAEWLARELALYETWAKVETDPVFQFSDLDRPSNTNLLVAGISVARIWIRQWHADRTPASGRLLRIAQIAFDLAATELYAGDLFNSAAEKHLRDRLQDGQSALWAVIHETDTFVHYLRLGVQPTPHFLSNSSRPEIDLHWKGKLIPVQCKRKSQGAGHFVARDVMVRLGVAVVRDAKWNDRRVITRMSASERFFPADIDAIRMEVLAIDPHRIVPVQRTINGRQFTFSIQPIEGNITAAEVAKKATDLGVSVGFVVGDQWGDKQSEQFLAAVSLTSDLDDGVRGATLARRTLRSSLDDAARQLSDGPPGIAAIHYFDGALPFDHDRPMPEEIRGMLEKWLNEHPEVRAIRFSAEPDFHSLNANGIAYGLLFDPLRLLPSDFPRGTAQPI